jgi:transcriptional regulator CtsR
LKNPCLKEVINDLIINDLIKEVKDDLINEVIEIKGGQINEVIEIKGGQINEVIEIKGGQINEVIEIKEDLIKIEKYKTSSVYEF